MTATEAPRIPGTPHPSELHTRPFRDTDADRAPYDTYDFRDLGQIVSAVYKDGKRAEAIFFAGGQAPAPLDIDRFRLQYTIEKADALHAEALATSPSSPADPAPVHPLPGREFLEFPLGEAALMNPYLDPEEFTDLDDEDPSAGLAGDLGEDLDDDPFGLAAGNGAPAPDEAEGRYAEYLEEKAAEARYRADNDLDLDDPFDIDGRYDDDFPDDDDPRMGALA